MKTLVSVLFGLGLVAIAMIGSAQPASARVGVYVSPFGFGLHVESYRNYCRDPWYRHRYWAYCRRFYDDEDSYYNDDRYDDYDDGDYDDDYDGGDFFLYDDDDRRFRHHRHHRDHDDWDGRGHHDRDGRGHHEHHETGEHHHHR